jgi:hypothetical protein
MAEAFRETTQWKGSTVKNGIYLLEGDKCLAFRNFKSETTYFTKPITIDKRGRTFEKLGKIPFVVEAEVKTDLREVAGSKGAIYYVNDEEKPVRALDFSLGESVATSKN